VNVSSTADLARSVSVPVIASGGVSSLADIDALLKIAPTTRTYGGGIIGLISGRALYDGSLDLSAALKRLKDAA
jgi:phosphoribosylformimino-5-aminoimidazole carboxamide ribotide isomerase